MCKEVFLDAHASLYLLVPVCPLARLSQLAFSKDDINAHPLRPMSYWFLNAQKLRNSLDKNMQETFLMFNPLTSTFDQINKSSIVYSFTVE